MELGPTKPLVLPNSDFFLSQPSLVLEKWRQDLASRGNPTEGMLVDGNDILNIRYPINRVGATIILEELCTSAFQKQK